MWKPKQIASGRWVCENSQTRDCTDATFATEEEAAAWANGTNEQWAKQKAEMDKREAERRAERAKRYANFPTDILTSRGDGWEGNG